MPLLENNNTNMFGFSLSDTNNNIITNGQTPVHHQETVIDSLKHDGIVVNNDNNNTDHAHLDVLRIDKNEPRFFSIPSDSSSQEQGHVIKRRHDDDDSIHQATNRLFTIHNPYKHGERAASGQNDEPGIEFDLFRINVSEDLEALAHIKENERQEKLAQDEQKEEAKRKKVEGALCSMAKDIVVDDCEVIEYGGEGESFDTATTHQALSIISIRRKLMCLFGILIKMDDEMVQNDDDNAAINKKNTNEELLN